MITTVLRLLRAKEWIKNTFLFIPAFFAGNILDKGLIFTLFYGFVAFSLTSSSIYILNDYQDRENDRRHPSKRFRPIASGAISVSVALPVSAILFAVAVAIAIHLPNGFFAVLALYFFMNISYSFGLKNISVVDIAMISLGFVLRVLAGGYLAEVPVSHWLIIMIFLLAMMMAIAKRRDDVLMYNHSGESMRKSIHRYNLDFTNVLLPMFASIIMVAYIMYTLSEEIQLKYGSEHIYFTAFFVMLGVVRYLQITMVERKSGSPTRILYSDPFIILTILGFILCFVYIIYW